MDVLEVRPNELPMIVLSHGHVDHTNGLMGMVGRLGERKMPLLTNIRMHFSSGSSCCRMAMKCAFPLSIERL